MKSIVHLQAEELKELQHVVRQAQIVWVEVRRRIVSVACSRARAECAMVLQSRNCAYYPHETAWKLRPELKQAYQREQELLQALIQLKGHQCSQVQQTCLLFGSLQLSELNIALHLHGAQSLIRVPGWMAVTRVLS